MSERVLVCQSDRPLIKAPIKIVRDSHDAVGGEGYMRSIDGNSQVIKLARLNLLVEDSQVMEIAIILANHPLVVGSTQTGVDEVIFVSIIDHDEPVCIGIFVDDLRSDANFIA